MSDGEKERESGFKVTDRRLFGPDGEPRSDVEPAPGREESAPAPPEPEKEAATPPPPPREPRPRSAPPADPHPFTAAPGEPPPPPDASTGPVPPDGVDPAEVGFSNFLLSLATTAMVGLGEMPDPATGLVAQNAESARQMIDILGMLKEKTQGNLNPEEARLLEGLLYELRMKFVAVQQGVGPASGPPPTGSAP